MVRRIIHFFGREIKGLHEAAYLLAFFAILSQILGLVRDRLFAGKFGAGELLDVYYAAFRIPDIAFTVIIALVSAAVLIPKITHLLDQDKEQQTVFINSIFSALLLLSVILCGLLYVFIPKLSELLFLDITQGPYRDELIGVTRILLLQPILLALSGFFSSFVQVFKKFYAYALSPIFYNVGIVIGILFFFPSFGIYGLALGVVLGALFHLCIQIPVVKGHGIVPKFTFKINKKYVYDVLRISIPRTIALAGSQITMLILISLAATLAVGSIAIFTFGFNLQSVPLAIIGASYSMAAFPTLSSLYKNKMKKQFIAHVLGAAKHVIFWSIPVMVLFIVLRAQIVRTVLGSGEFSWSDTRLVAAALALFSISVVAQSLILLLSRAFYAAGETKRPLFFAIISLALTIFSAFGLLFAYKTSPAFVAIFESIMRVDSGTGSAVLMLPLAFSIGQLWFAGSLWISFQKQYQCFSKELVHGVWQSIVASLCVGLTSYLLLQILAPLSIIDTTTLMGIFAQGFIAGIGGILVGVFILLLLENDEIFEVWHTAHAKIWKRKITVALGDE